MKLLVVSTWFPYPPDNGSKLRAFHLIRELAWRHTISLLSFSDSGEVAADRLAPLEEICDSVDVISERPFHRGRLGIRGLMSPVPRSFVQSWVPEMEARIRRSVSGCDAVVALQISTATYLRDIDERPVVFEEAEVAVIREEFTSADWPIRRVRRGLTWWKYARFVRSLANQFGHTTVVSEVERALLERIGCNPRRLSVVPNGVDTADLKWPRTPRPARLIYPGALTYSANYDAVRWFLDEVLPIVRRTRPEVEFWVTGSTNGVAVSELPNANLMTLTGHLPDVRAAVADSTISVVPLRIGGGTRLKVLQAMALGTPVVSTSKGVEGLAVSPGRDILLGDTAEGFASQVLRLLSDTALWDRLSAAARTLVAERYTWSGSGALLDSAVHAAVAAWKASHA